MTTNQKLLMKEFFTSTTAMWFYDWSVRSREFAWRILGLIGNIFGETSTDECRDVVENTSCLQKMDDILLMNAVKDGYSEDVRMAIGLKTEIIVENNIKHIKSFDSDLLLVDVIERAVCGEIHACKLWAYANWEGIGCPVNKRVAIEQWEMLAVNGDVPSMMALEYAYSSMGQRELSNMWATVKKLCAPQMKILSEVSEKSNICTDEKAKELVEIINCIKSRMEKNDGKHIDGCMSQYALYGRDPLVTKLRNISTESNFYMILFNDRQSSQRTTIGF